MASPDQVTPAGGETSLPSSLPASRQSRRRGGGGRLHPEAHSRAAAYPSIGPERKQARKCHPPSSLDANQEKRGKTGTARNGHSRPEAFSEAQQPRLFGQEPPPPKRTSQVRLVDPLPLPAEWGVTLARLPIRGWSHDDSPLARQRREEQSPGLATLRRLPRPARDTRDQPPHSWTAFLFICTRAPSCPPRSLTRTAKG